MKTVYVKFIAQINSEIYETTRLIKVNPIAKINLEESS